MTVNTPGATTVRLTGRVVLPWPLVVLVKLTVSLYDAGGRSVRTQGPPELLPRSRLPAGLTPSRRVRPGLRGALAVLSLSVTCPGACQAFSSGAHDHGVCPQPPEGVCPLLRQADAEGPARSGCPVTRSGDPCGRRHARGALSSAERHRAPAPCLAFFSTFSPHRARASCTDTCARIGEPTPPCGVPVAGCRPVPSSASLPAFSHFCMSRRPGWSSIRGSTIRSIPWGSLVAKTPGRAASTPKPYRPQCQASRSSLPASWARLLGR